MPTYGRDVRIELTTPTGAALLAALVHGVRAAARHDGDRVGLRRRRRRAGRPAQLHPGRRSASAPTGRPSVPGKPALLLETNLDDVTGEQLGLAVAAALEAGAFDAWVSPVTMKKGRPGHVLHVLTDATLVERLARRDATGHRHHGDPCHGRGAVAGRPARSSRSPSTASSSA